MFCKKCGKIVKEGAAFCASCGAPVAAAGASSGSTSPAERPRRPRKEHVPMSKKKKTCIILSAVAGLLIAAVISGLVYYLQSPARKAAALFADGDTAAAWDLYLEEGIKDNKLQSWIFSGRMNSECKKAKTEYDNNEIDCISLLGFLSTAISTDGVDESWKNTYNEILNQRCDVIKTAFASGEMDYSTATEELMALETLDLYGTNPEKYTDSTLALVENKQAQLTEYNDAMEMYESGDLEGAIERLSSIDEGSPKYAEAQEKYAAAVEAYRSDVVQNVNDFIERNDFSQAIILLKHALRILDGDDELTGMLESCEESYAEDVRYEAMTRSTELIADKEYAQALKVLAEALDKLGQDLTLQSAYDDCVSVYVKDIVAKADQLMQDKAFSDAISLVNTALQVLPNNSDLLAKKTELEEARPLSITDALMINSTLFYGGPFPEWNSGAPIDTFGNDYSRAANYAILGCWNDGTYEEYRVYGKYATITGTIAPYYDTHVDRTWWLQIYADDRLVYTSPVVGRKTDAIDFSVNISGADYIKLVITSDGYSVHGILSNVLLWK